MQLREENNSRKLTLVARACSEKEAVLKRCCLLFAGTGWGQSPHPRLVDWVWTGSPMAFLPLESNRQGSFQPAWARAKGWNRGPQQPASIRSWKQNLSVLFPWLWFWNHERCKIVGCQSCGVSAKECCIQGWNQHKKKREVLQVTMLDGWSHISFWKWVSRNWARSYRIWCLSSWISG